MIAYLRGTLMDKGPDQAVIETGGVGYEVFVNASTAGRLPEAGAAMECFIAESVGMYGGVTTLYGFLTREEKDMFLCFKDNIPSTGAKKALEYLDKAARSLPDFRRAVLDEDARLLTDVFGFTKKTAEKIMAALKDKMAKVSVTGEERLRRVSGSFDGGAMGQALEALGALGYRPAECRSALEAVTQELAGRAAPVEELIRMALRKL